METSLVLDNKSRHLCFLAKKRFEHSSDVTLKLRGVLNTVTTANQVDGSLQKFLRVGKLPLYGSDDVYRPDPRLRLGIGARASTATDDIFLSLTARQVVPVGKGVEVVRGRQVLRSYTQAKLRARYDYNIRTEAWGGEAVVAASHAIFRFADDQDVRLTAGCRVPLTPSGPRPAEPFLRLEENCWSVTTNMKRDWRVEYCL